MLEVKTNLFSKNLFRKNDCFEFSTKQINQKWHI